MLYLCHTKPRKQFVDLTELGVCLKIKKGQNIIFYKQISYPSFSCQDLTCKSYTGPSQRTEWLSNQATVLWRQIQQARLLGRGRDRVGCKNDSDFSISPAHNNKIKINVALIFLFFVLSQNIQNTVTSLYFKQIKRKVNGILELF